MIDLQFLKSVNWKRHINTGIKVFSDFKNLALLALFAFIIYGIGWDTVLKPNLQLLEGRNKALQKQNDILSKQNEQQKQYDVWEQQLKGLAQDMIEVGTDNSSRVLSVSESTELQKIAQGLVRDESLPPLQPPHDRRSGISILPTANSTIEIMGLLEPNNPQAAKTPTVAEPGEQNGEAGEIKAQLSVDQFDYDLKVSGTYPALVDLINQIMLHKKLVKINKIVLTKPADDNEPDPKEYPDYPVKLDMVMSISLLLYATDPTAATLGK